MFGCSGLYYAADFYSVGHLTRYRGTGAHKKAFMFVWCLTGQPWIWRTSWQRRFSWNQGEKYQRQHHNDIWNWYTQISCYIMTQLGLKQSEKYVWQIRAWKISCRWDPLGFAVWGLISGLGSHRCWERRSASVEKQFAALWEGWLEFSWAEKICIGGRKVSRSIQFLSRTLYLINISGSVDLSELLMFWPINGIKYGLLTVLKQFLLHDKFPNCIS